MLYAEDGTLGGILDGTLNGMDTERKTARIGCGVRRAGPLYREPYRETDIQTGQQRGRQRAHEYYEYCEYSD